MSENLIFKALNEVENTVRESTAELADRVLRLEQKGTGGAMNHNDSRYGETLGSIVARKFNENLESFKKHKVISLEIETKSITASIVGARASIAPTAGPDAVVDTQLLTKLQMKEASGVAALVYPRRSVAIIGGAAAVGENVTRPQSEPIYVSIQQAICTVAGHAVLSETALRTTGELESVVNLHLTADVLKAADLLLIAGGTNFAGGLLALATPDVLPIAQSNDLLEESIAIEVMTMRSLGYKPDVVIVNPNDWRAVYLRRETGGLYVHSSPLMQAPLVISGCAVIFSSSVTTKQAVVLDSRYCDFMPSGQLRIEVAYVASQFLTGEVTVRGELQGIPVVRDLAAIKLVSRA